MRRRLSVTRCPIRRLSLCLLCLGLTISSLALSGGEASSDGPARVDPQTALSAGNRLFRAGRIEEAVAAYLAGFSPEAPHPTLLYNMGTALHHLDRLPEAILWYRRAAESEDPWLVENLWLARRSLGSQVLPPGGSLGWLSRHTTGLRWTAVALAWITLLIFVASPRLPRWLLLTTALAAMMLYLTAAAVELWGLRPAVVLEDCFTGAAELPAGTEAWVRPGAEGAWQVSGAIEVTCPAAAVELVFPRG